MRRRLLTLISLLASLAVAGTVYKWVDENGVVHYSDQPHPEAQKVDVPPAQTYKGGASVPAMPTTGPSAPPASSEPASAYQGCAISEPAKDQTFTNVDALSVVVRTDPGLRPGDRVYLTLDGQPLNGGNPTGSQFTLSPVDRGTHVVQAIVRDSQGGLMCQSPRTPVRGLSARCERPVADPAARARDGRGHHRPRARRAPGRGAARAAHARCHHHAAHRSHRHAPAPRARRHHAAPAHHARERFARAPRRQPPHGQAAGARDQKSARGTARRGAAPRAGAPGGGAERVHAGDHQRSRPAHGAGRLDGGPEPRAEQDRAQRARDLRARLSSRARGSAHRRRDRARLRPEPAECDARPASAHPGSPQRGAQRTPGAGRSRAHRAAHARALERQHRLGAAPTGGERAGRGRRPRRAAAPALLDLLPARYRARQRHRPRACGRAGPRKPQRRHHRIRKRAGAHGIHAAAAPRRKAMNGSALRVWLVDDDASIRRVLERALRNDGMAPRAFEAAEPALDALRRESPDVLITDIRMPGASGLELLKRIHDARPQLPVIVMTAHSDLANAVSAYEGGAFEYLAKPFDIDQAIALVRRAASAGQQPGNDPGGAPRMPELLGTAPAMQQVFRAIGRLSRSSVTVLITGESGTGKELVARALHEHSPRAERPFIALNTAAIPADLLESELRSEERRVGK